MQTRESKVIASLEVFLQTGLFQRFVRCMPRLAAMIEREMSFGMRAIPYLMITLACANKMTARANQDFDQFVIEACQNLCGGGRGRAQDLFGHQAHKNIRKVSRIAIQFHKIRQRANHLCF